MKMARERESVASESFAKIGMPALGCLIQRSPLPKFAALRRGAPPQTASEVDSRFAFQPQADNTRHVVPV
jgi:hypothetical protein